MAIITLSRGTYNGAKDLAEYISQQLGYRLLAREDIIDKIKEWGISEPRIEQALHGRVGILQRMNLEWIRYLAFLRAVLAKEVQASPNMVYHGTKGQIALQGFPHVLSIKVVATMEYRIEAVMRRNAYGMSKKEAQRLIKNIDDDRNKWAEFLYHEDLKNDTDYDLVIDLSRLSVPEAFEIVQTTIELPKFQPTADTPKEIENLALAADLRARIARDANIIDDQIGVEIHDGAINITGSVHSIEDADELRRFLSQQPEVTKVESHLKAPLQETYSI